VKVAGGGKSLSVLATPQAERNQATYELSDSDRATLRKVLAEDIEAPQAPEGP